MRVVVDIPNWLYNAMLEHKEPIYSQSLGEAVRDGTPLPKGHGRLIDADALEKKMCDREVEIGDDRALWESSAVSVALDMFAPTIIDADKESNNE